jgi:hypothetical protein
VRGRNQPAALELGEAAVGPGALVSGPTCIHILVTSGFEKDMRVGIERHRLRALAAHQVGNEDAR